MADQTLADILAAYGAADPRNQLADQYPAQSLEGAEQRSSPNGLWGPKTATNDEAHYLPESLVGELPYRYQGVALHGLLAALRYGGPGLFGRLLQIGNVLTNGGYVAGSLASGRTAPVRRVEDQLPMPRYSPPS